MTPFGIWLSAIGTLAIFSFLYKDNPLYRATEQILVGLSVGYLIVMTFQSTLIPRVVNPVLNLEGWGFVACFWVLLMWTRLSAKYNFMSRWPLAIIVGAGAGLSIPAMLKARIITQLGATIRTEITIDVIIGAAGVISTLSYFYFTRPQTGPFRAASKLGTLYLMVFFGATFGYTIMSRLSLLIGRTEFLLGSWLGIL
jgi:hypothetical protein